MQLENRLSFIRKRDLDQVTLLHPVFRLVNSDENGTILELEGVTWLNTIRAYVRL
jgi:hypothetical protein